MTVFYKASEVAKRLGLKESTLKKYYLALEKEGYSVKRNPSNHRMFTDDDMQIIEQFRELIKYDGMTIELAAKEIAKSHKKEGVTDSHNVMALLAAAMEQREYELATDKRESMFIERVQDILEEKSLRLEKELAIIKKHNKELIEANKRIEQLLSEKKNRWFFWRKK